MDNLCFAMAQVTERAALAGYSWLGRGDKERADAAAVEAMRQQLSHTQINATIVIGEGEIDEAPMLYIGEQLGLGGIEVDIAVDPIEGTRMTAMGQSNALAVLAAAPKGTLLQAPDMYMEKLVVGPQAKHAIDLSRSLEDNLKSIARALSKPINELVVATLAKPRHDQVIEKMQNLGVRVYAFPDGDVAASLLTCLEESEVDAMYCIGGAPEGVISAAVVQAMGGDMQARLLLRDHVKGKDSHTFELAKIELQRCQAMGVTPNTVLPLSRLAKSSDIIFAATGITKGDVLNGVQKRGKSLTTETLLVQGQSKKIRIVKSTHGSSQLASELKLIAI
ncbi:class II fructose-bisphosphatase [Vibrio sp. J1-1]|uniref:class II fructose-bisphosphatase n=1 Tax=Vibrio sp. J1-1 TaxID=2912251 RepID=UPI001F024F94|nr:class II fructose-bisphosphatase [Vibrio sp. J1-1]MCF7481525.1 class II fructose-bisphosphatase [Vibrio sp. J1-1]